MERAFHNRGMGNVREALRVRNRMRLPAARHGGGEDEGRAEGQGEQLKRRRQAASFVAAAGAGAAHREFVERSADEQCRALCRHGAADLSVLSSHLAAAVAAEMVGLTGNRGVVERLESFSRGLRAGRRGVSGRLGVRTFLWRDVRPAVADRRRARRDDLISHLLDEGCTRPGELGECVTVAVAGMVAAREFITVAAWRLLTDDGLRARYTGGGDAGRAAVLREILDQEPVIADRLRWTGASPGGGSDAGRPGGEPGSEDAGVRLAVQEADIFLRKLFAMPGLRLLREPTVIIRSDLAAYELRGLILAV